MIRQLFCTFESKFKKIVKKRFLTNENKNNDNVKIVIQRIKTRFSSNIKLFERSEKTASVLTVRFFPLNIRYRVVFVSWMERYKKRGGHCPRDGHVTTLNARCVTAVKYSRRRSYVAGALRRGGTHGCRGHSRCFRGTFLADVFVIRRPL